MFDRVLLVCWGMLWLGGCGPGESTRPTSPPGGERSSIEAVPQGRPAGTIRLAAVFPDSGRFVGSGRECFRGVAMAVDAVNAEGGVHGRTVDLVRYATRSNVESTEAESRRAVAEGAVAIIGSNASMLSRAVAEVAEEEQIVMVTNVSTATDLTLNRPFVFRTCYSNRLLADRLAQFVWTDTRLAARRVAVLQEVSRPYSKDLGDQFTRFFGERLRQAGLPDENVQTWPYISMESDFTPYLDRIRRFAPDVLFLPSGFDDATIVALHLKAMDYDLAVVGGDSWASDRLFLGQDSGLLAFHSDHWNPDRARSFIDTYRQRFHCSPQGGRAALAHDAVRAVVEALHAIGGPIGEDALRGEGLRLTRRRLRECLARVEITGVSGPLRFDRDGNARKPCFVFQMKGGQRVLAAVLDGEEATTKPEEKK